MTQEVYDALYATNCIECPLNNRYFDREIGEMMNTCRHTKVAYVHSICSRKPRWCPYIGNPDQILPKIPPEGTIEKVESSQDKD